VLRTSRHPRIDVVLENPPHKSTSKVKTTNKIPF
jgi:hypothetical protein